MKRILLALCFSPWLAGAAHAGNDAPPVPPPPHAPLPPLPPLPPMSTGSSASSVATLDVKGTVTLRADVLSSDIEVVGVGGQQIKAQLIDSSGGVRLSQAGDRVELSLQSKGGWPHVPAGIDGKLRIEVPQGTNVELTSASGDIAVHDTGGNVRLRTASGEVHLRKVAGVEVMAVSGDVVVDNASGEVRLRTVSGDAAGHAERRRQHQARVRHDVGRSRLDGRRAAPAAASRRARCRATSSCAWRRTSSFDLRYVSHSGDVTDDLKMQTLEQRESRHGGGSLHARYGKGEGLVEAQTFSGDLHIARK